MKDPEEVGQELRAREAEQRARGEDLAQSASSQETMRVLLEKRESKIAAREAFYEDRIRKAEAQYARRIALAEEDADHRVENARLALPRITLRS